MDSRKKLTDKLLRADGIDPSAVSEDELARFRQLINRAKQARHSWRNIMRNPITKLSIAAAVVIAAALLGLHFFSDTSSITWADVLEQVLTFDTCVYRSRTVETSGPRPDSFEFATENESMEYRSETYGSFSESYEKGELAKRAYTLLKDKKYIAMFIRANHDNLCLRASLNDQQIQEHIDSDPRRIISKILNGKYTELGQNTIDGKSVRGISLDDPNLLAHEGKEAPTLDDFSSSIWIDTKTGLPVWVEVSILPKGSPMRMTMIWDRFQWGVPLEASLFVPNITDDFEVVDDPGSAPDSTPETEAAKAFALNTMSEPYLSDFDHLPLPDLSNLVLLGVDITTQRPETRLLGTNEIWLAQDATIAAWPKYEQVQTQLHNELQEKRGIDNMTANQLVTTGISLRNRFWTLGGCLSETSYPYIYASRLVIEKAAELAPERTEIIDQLIETIMSYSMSYTWDAETESPVESNPVYAGIITDLRIRQFDLLEAKVEDGYRLKWKDFVRSADMVFLCSKRKDFDIALEANQLLLDQMETGGWTYYKDRITGSQERLTAGERTMIGTFLGGIGDVVYERYGRRLWSFQGPPEYKQSRVPFHMRHLKGW
jgi:hypothetical protein